MIDVFQCSHKAPHLNVSLVGVVPLYDPNSAKIVSSASNRSAFNNHGVLA